MAEVIYRGKAQGSFKPVGAITDIQVGDWITFWVGGDRQKQVEGESHTRVVSAVHPGQIATEPLWSSSEGSGRGAAKKARKKAEGILLDKGRLIDARDIIEAVRPSIGGVSEPVPPESIPPRKPREPEPVEVVASPPEPETKKVERPKPQKVEKPEKAKKAPEPQKVPEPQKPKKVTTKDLGDLWAMLTEG